MPAIGPGTPHACHRWRRSGFSRQLAHRSHHSSTILDCTNPTLLQRLLNSDQNSTNNQKKQLILKKMVKTPPIRRNSLSYTYMYLLSDKERKKQCNCPQHSDVGMCAPKDAVWESSFYAMSEPRYFPPVCVSVLELGKKVIASLRET